jgi:hypothetical protein
MKAIFPLLLASLALAVSLNARAAEGHPHEHGSSETQQLQLNAGKKWATDKPLRLVMHDINRAMAKALPLIHRERFSDDDYQALAETVNRKVAYAVAHCQLAPQADAMLHLIIANLLAGAETMAGKTEHTRHEGAVQVLAALHDYGRYFQHPAWQAAGA